MARTRSAFTTWPATRCCADFDVPASRQPGPGSLSPPSSARLAAIGLKGVPRSGTWPPARGSPTCSFKPATGNFGGPSGGSVVFSPDGRVLAAAHAYYTTTRNTGTPPRQKVYLWNISKGTEIAHIEGSELSKRHPGFLSRRPRPRHVPPLAKPGAVLLLKADTGRELRRGFEGSQANFIEAFGAFPRTAACLARPSEKTMSLARSVTAGRSALQASASLSGNWPPGSCGKNSPARGGSPACFRPRWPNARLGQLRHHGAALQDTKRPAKRRAQSVLCALPPLEGGVRIHCVPRRAANSPIKMG